MKLAVIPARYGSTRFPGKPLALLLGKPMVQWVYERAAQARGFDAVVVATDDDRIANIIKGVGGTVCMTHSEHLSGTDRVWEVAGHYPDATLIFNVQGDEPLINPLHLEEVIAGFARDHENLLLNHSVDMVTLKAPIKTQQEREDGNIVKVVTNAQEDALYFSRASIPAIRDTTQALELGLQHSYRHIGIYGFTRESLARFVQLPPSRLEQLEQLEQLRALEDGMRIRVMTVEEAPISVDTPEDVARVEQRLEREQSLV